jgi:hypothetical protein
LEASGVEQRETKTWLAITPGRFTNATLAVVSTTRAQNKTNSFVAAAERLLLDDGRR